MASGHVNRTNRPNTWLHRPACDVKISLANPEPSTHGTSFRSGNAAGRAGPDARRAVGGRPCQVAHPTKVGDIARNEEIRTSVYLGGEPKDVSGLNKINDY
jgi:hypothetical protein